MGIGLEFNELGYYQAGIHKLTLDEFKNNFVNPFGESTSRKRIYENFLDFFFSEYITPFHSVISRVWIDGSFTTSKLNPNDIDWIIFLKFKNDEEFNLTNQFMKLYKKSLKAFAYNYDCDLYIIYDKDEVSMPNINDETKYFLQNIDLMFKYWMGQFTFDRKQNPKGIFELTFEGGAFQ